MAIFAVNRGFQISFEIQSRSLLISSLARKGYSKSEPIRYIPKSNSNIRKPQKDPALESSEEKEGILFKNGALKGKWGPHKFHKFVAKDCKISNSRDILEQVEELPELDDANSSTLELTSTVVGSKDEPILDEVSNLYEDMIANHDDLLSLSVRQDAEKMAIELLAARAFTEIELRKKLHGKRYPSNIVELVITDIKTRGLLNDGLYAESFSRSRWLSLTWGPRRIKQALVQKGVKEVEAEKAMKQVFEGDEADGEKSQTMRYGMSKSSMDRLFIQASKQWLRGQNTSPENRKARIVRWLQYRGFNWGVTNSILKKLEAQYPS